MAAMLPGAGGLEAGKHLATDYASRMARAKEMGFVTEVPLYHGTAHEFSEFDPSKRAINTHAAPARQGVWTALSPDVANDFSHMSAATGGAPAIMPLLHRSERRGRVVLEGNEGDHEIAATLAQAWDDGYTSVMLHNYTAPGVEKGGKKILLPNPSLSREGKRIANARKRSAL